MLEKAALKFGALQDFVGTVGMKTRKDAPYGRVPKNANALYLRKAGFGGWKKLLARRQATHEILHTWAADHNDYLLFCMLNSWHLRVIVAHVHNAKALQRVDEQQWRTRMKAFMGWTLIINQNSSESRWLDMMVDANGGLDGQRGIWESEVERLERELERTRLEAMGKGARLPEPKLDGGMLFRNPPPAATSSMRSPTRRRPSAVRSP